LSEAIPNTYSLVALAVRQNDSSYMSFATAGLGLIEIELSLLFQKEPVSGVMRVIAALVLSAKLNRESHQYLKNIANVLRSNQYWQALTIVGHADASGHAERHQKLSSQRAIAVYTFLKKEGVDSSKISIRGASSEEPVASNNNEAGKTTNRRAELWITADPHHVDELANQLLPLTVNTEL